MRALPNLNFGAFPLLSVSGVPDHQRRVLVRYNLGDLPPGAHVVAASAQFMVILPTHDPIHIYRATEPWREYRANWYNAALDFDRTAVYGTLLAPLPYATASADITTLVQSWLCGAPNNGMMLIAAGDDDPALFFSREAREPERRPTLELTIAPGNATCAAP